MGLRTHTHTCTRTYTRTHTHSLTHTLTLPLGNLFQALHSLWCFFSSGRPKIFLSSFLLLHCNAFLTITVWPTWEKSSYPSPLKIFLPNIVQSDLPLVSLSLSLSLSPFLSLSLSLLAVASYIFTVRSSLEIVTTAVNKCLYSPTFSPQMYLELLYGSSKTWF